MNKQLLHLQYLYQLPWISNTKVLRPLPLVEFGLQPPLVPVVAHNANRRHLVVELILFETSTNKKLSNVVLAVLIKARAPMEKENIESG